MSLARLRPLLVLAVLASSSPLAAATTEEGLALEFEVPGQAVGDVTSTATWALLVFSESSAAELRLDADGPSSAVNHTRVELRARSGGFLDSSVPQEQDDRAVNVADDLQAALTFDGSWSSLLVEADSIEIGALATRTTLRSSVGSNYATEYIAAEEGGGFQTIRLNNTPLPAGAALTLQAETPHAQVPFRFDARGVRRAEWHNATVACPSSPCPDGFDGARPFGPTVPLPGGSAQARTMPFFELHPANGTLQGTGSALYLVALGDGMDVSLNGWARFPEAVLEGDCDGSACPDPAGRTLQAEGDLVLRGLSPAPGSSDRLRAGFGGSVVRARIDEEPIGELGATAAWVGGAAVGLTLLARALGGLFARNPRPVLEYPRTKAAYDLVHGTPGLSFGQVRERLGWAHGTTQYHLRRLLKAGLVVAYAYRNSVRYYENHGRHLDDWQEFAALQKPALRELHGWIAEHPRSNQRQIVAAAAKWGWTRSTTQNRLRELLEARLIENHRTPLAVEYVAVRPASPARDAAPAPTGSHGFARVL